MKLNPLIFLLLILFVSPARSAQIVDSIVAIVNDQIITMSDMRSFEHRLKEEGLFDELIANGNTADQLIKNKDLQLNYLINERIIDSLIKKNGLEVTSEQVEREIKQMAAQNNLSRAQLVEALRAQGINLSDYQDFIKTRIERQRLIEQEVSSRIQITDDEVLSAYNRQNPDRNKTIYEYTLSHILFLPEQGDGSKALERAKSVLKQVKQGHKSFEALAKEHSEDPGFTDGGLLGTFRAGEILPEIEKAVSNLDEGQTTDIIRSRAGFHIVRLNEKKMIPDPAFLRERETYRNRLFEQAFKKNFATWLEQQKSDSFIRIN